MFFPQRICSIPNGAKVLEIGPGSTPFAGATHYLELSMATEEERVRQRGDVVAAPEFRGKPVSFYDGGRFPFADDAFGYVIASHVIEHVPSPELFMQEIFRVGSGRGYLEFPQMTYEYMFDFDVHRHVVGYEPRTRLLSYIPKADLPFKAFEPVTARLRPMLENNWMDVIKLNPDYFFQGFEFDAPFEVRRASSVDALMSPEEKLSRRSRWAGAISQILTRLI
ncbi:class I SAM-dependent methyltransferase [Variovorax sp. PBL-E5]|uniref:class I SAM-dependent methyltransferase n=1 Tax=Variovorax sp. PBL-E5 TaxID=434014 RepID=UPI0013176111|nr:methyltransferase domain-containing protein [Variovorax sp. PBL-E5]VTU40118.1 Methyltransferase domain protein [Variovorax sp. PBL-E5]